MSRGSVEVSRFPGAGLARLASAAGVLVLAATGFLFDALTPWAYLNVAGGLVLVGFARIVGLRYWWAIAVLPLWQVCEVSLYCPWVDPGIPISLFVNLLLGLAVLIAVLVSPVSA